MFEEILLKIFMPLSGIVSVLIFSWKLRSRNFFWLRLLCYVAVYILLDYLSSIAAANLSVWLHCIFNVAMFFAVSFALLLVYDEKISVLLFCGISGKCTMHIAEYVSKIIFYFTLQNTYISIAIYAVIYVIIYFLFARSVRGEELRYLNYVKVVTFALVIIIVTDILILCFNNSGLGVSYSTNLYVFALIAIICIVLLYMQYCLLAESKQKEMSVLMSHLREKEREQYEVSKQNINLIAIRQHDLKNMLSSRLEGLSESAVNEIVSSLDGYNLPFRTGNRSLDTILMEKHMECKSRNIRLECLADGADLNFMSELDVYSLFLNALNNAIESADKIEDESKRVIWLKTYKRGNLLFVQIQNYYQELVRTSGGFATTKQDKLNHGFGLKSMRMIAVKYGGEMSVKTDNDLFCLGVVFTLPD